MHSYSQNKFAVVVLLDKTCNCKLDEHCYISLLRSVPIYTPNREGREREKEGEGQRKREREKEGEKEKEGGGAGRWWWWGERACEPVSAHLLHLPHGHCSPCSLFWFIIVGLNSYSHVSSSDMAPHFRPYWCDEKMWCLWSQTTFVESWLCHFSIYETLVIWFNLSVLQFPHW